MSLITEKKNENLKKIIKSHMTNRLSSDSSLGVSKMLFKHSVKQQQGGGYLKGIKQNVCVRDKSKKKKEEDEYDKKKEKNPMKNCCDLKDINFP